MGDACNAPRMHKLVASFLFVLAFASPALADIDATPDSGRDGGTAPAASSGCEVAGVGMAEGSLLFGVSTVAGVAFAIGRRRKRA